MPRWRHREEDEGAAETRARVRAEAAAVRIPPKPDRLPPFVLESPHEAKPELDVDWTLVPGNHPMELRLRQVRNELIKDALLNGRHVCYEAKPELHTPLMRCLERTFHCAVDMT